jgi:large subunit ribosomal protein L15
MPLQRRMPKLRGFRNPNREAYTVVNIDRLTVFAAGSTVTPDDLRARGLVKHRGRIKVLGEGELSGALRVHAHAFSLGASEKIKAAGGTVEVIE